MAKSLLNLTALTQKPSRYEEPEDTYFGFVRVAAAVTRTEVANPVWNLKRHLAMVRKFKKNRVDIGLFPELSLTGYSCARLFQQATVRRAALKALIQMNRAVKEMGYNGVVIVGVPLVIDDGLYNCAVAMCRGQFLGVSVKRHPPGYEEFLEPKWFSYARNLTSTSMVIDGQEVPVGIDLVFDCLDVPGLKFAMPICEDDWTMAASSFFYVANGATVLCSLNGSNELIGKERYRSEQQVVGMSSRCVAAYIYASQGAGESTTDVVFSGYCGIADNGSLLVETKPLDWVDTYADPKVMGETMIFKDVDLDHIVYDRLRMNSFIESAADLRKLVPHRHLPFTLERPNKPRRLARQIGAHPYVPQSKEALAEVCQKLTKIKLAGDITRLTHIGNPPVWIAVSGGLDSTARLLDAVKAMDTMGRPRSEIHAVTMPGFGTTKRTYGNVVALCAALGVTFHEVDIKPLCFMFMKAIGHKPFGLDITSMKLEEFLEALKNLPADAKDLVFENVQAHMRTVVITRQGFAFGTGDMSELIIGWCTWLADQLGGHYNSQGTMPKTLVRFQVQWQAENEFDGEIRARLLDILDTAVSPELLPADAKGEIRQKTDDAIGPEEVRDFFMRYFRRFGDTAEKIMYLIQHAEGFKRQYLQEELQGWWQQFSTRVFQWRIKNATRVDGVQVGPDSLNPHGNWIIPSDASSAAWQLPAGFDITPFIPQLLEEKKAAKRSVKKCKSAKKSR